MDGHPASVSGGDDDSAERDSIVFDFVLLDDDRVALTDALTPLSWKRQATLVALAVLTTAVLLLSSTDTALALAIGAGGVIGAAGVRLFRPLVIRRQLTRYDIRPVSIRVQVGDETIEHREDGLRVEVSWSRVRRCIVTSTIVVFEYAPLRSVCIPRRAMASGDLERLEQMATRLAGVPTGTR